MDRTQAAIELNDAIEEIILEAVRVQDAIPIGNLSPQECADWTSIMRNTRNTLELLSMSMKTTHRSKELH